MCKNLQAFGFETKFGSALYIPADCDRLNGVSSILRVMAKCGPWKSYYGRRHCKGAWCTYRELYCLSTRSMFWFYTLALIMIKKQTNNLLTWLCMHLWPEYSGVPKPQFESGRNWFHSRETKCFIWARVNACFPDMPQISHWGFISTCFQSELCLHMLCHSNVQPPLRGCPEFPFKNCGGKRWH